MKWLQVGLITALCASVSPRVRAEPAAAHRELPRVSYAAPASCPDVQVAQELLGDEFVVQAGTADRCPSCTRSIVIDERTRDAARFHVVVSAAANHREELARPACSDALAFAAHVVLATHVADEQTTRANASGADAPRRQSSRERANATPREGNTEPPFRVGVFGSLLIAPATGERVTLLGGGLGVLLDAWRVSPHVAWIGPREVQSTLGETVPLNQLGYAAGIDVCRRAYARLHACGLGSVRWMTVDPGSIYTKQAGSEVLVGGAIGWLQDLPARFELEVQLGALVAPVPMPFQDQQGQTIYTNPAVEAQLRVGLAWGFDVASTAPRSGAEPVSRVRRASR